MRYVITCNAGSSSLKVGIFDSEKRLEEQHSAQIENIGQSATQLYIDGADPVPTEATSHTSAAEALAQWIVTTIGQENVAAVGHRVVHGAAMYQAPTVITQEVVQNLHGLTDLDPEHMPAILESIAELRRHFPNQQHIACFDTAFYVHLPKRASLLPIPRHYYDKGVRRYGFHGLSYQYLLGDFARHEGEQAAQGNIVLAHLGSGASLAAVKGGQVQDMTMGFTPASGIVMSTRSGDLDPGLVRFLHTTSGQTADEFNTMVNHQSGLLGISETSADMYTLLQNQVSDERAREAVELFCYQVSKSIGALSASIGGINSLIFAGGIGERSAEIRARVCENLAFLGIELDDVRNAQSERRISKDGSKAGVHVIPTNEAMEIARQTLKKTNEGAE